MMKLFKQIVALLVLTSLVLTTNVFAAEKRDKFGADLRHEAEKKELRSIKPSTETFKWKMVMPWSKGLLFFDMAQHLADSVKLASGGRLDTKVFSAGELVGALAVSYTHLDVYKRQQQARHGIHRPGRRHTWNLFPLGSINRQQREE